MYQVALLCAGDSARIMERLPHDVMVIVADKLQPRDQKHLHLVCKSLQAAVEGAAVSLRPSNSPTGAQLVQLCAKFPRAVSLNLWWLSDSDLIAHLPAALLHLLCLETFRLGNCTVLTELHFAVCSLPTTLQRLSLSYCQSLKALPEEIGLLTSLK